MDHGQQPMGRSTSGPSGSHSKASLAQRLALSPRLAGALLALAVLPVLLGANCGGGSGPSFVARFTSGTANFFFEADGFRGTANPTYASGAYAPADGFDGGGLGLELGGVDELVVGGISGGWFRGFSLPTADVVTVTLRYRLQMTAAYGPGTCSQVLVSVDGLLAAPSGEVIEELCGDFTAQDTGWQQATFDLLLSEGSHFLRIGGWSSGKASAAEVTTIHFDDVSVSASSDPIDVELVCEDALDNDGDGLADCADPDCGASSWCEGSAELSCQDLFDNDGDGLLDCDDSDCLGTAGCPLFAGGFDTGAEGFAFVDDAFFGSSHPDYASGSWDPAGGAAGGGLTLQVGGVDGTVVVGGISGGFTRSFDLAAAGVVRISFSYRMLFPDAYESNECSQVLVSVDGQISGPGVRDPLLEYCGGVPSQDSGWVDVSFEVPLAAGTHDLTLGAWNNRKNQLEEVTTVSFDDVAVTPLLETVLLQEPFDTAGFPGWSVVDQSGDTSEWSVADGLLLQDDARIEQLVTSFYLGTVVHADTGSTWDDYRVRAKLESPDENPDGGDPDTVGLLFRYQGPDDYYRLVLSRKLGFRRLEKRVAGTFSNLAFDGRSFEPGRGVDVTVDVRGSRIVVEIDGERVFAVEDGDLATGTVGLHAESRASFESVAVTQPAWGPRATLATPGSFSVAVPLGAAQTDRLPTACLVSDAPGAQVRFLLDPGTPSEQEIVVPSAPYETEFQGVAPGDHVVRALLETEAGVVDVDERVVVGVEGNSLVGFGDSITEGVGDALLAASLDGRNAGRGYTPPLNDGLTAATLRPTIVFNEGVGGQESDQGAARIGETLQRHPDADVWLVLFGTNDSRDPARLSGIGCSEADLAAALPGCVGTYKDHMRTIVLSIQAAGAFPVLGKVPYAVGVPAARDAAIQEYNQVIDQLVAEHGLTVTPPDFYTYFFMNQGQMADALHPTFAGYQAMAGLWTNAIVASGLLD